MTWWALFGMAAITFLNRYAFLTDAVQYQPGEKTKRFLSYSSYAVLTAIWTPIVFNFDPSQGIDIAGADYLIAASAAALMTVLKAPSILTVIVSTGLFFALRFL